MALVYSVSGVAGRASGFMAGAALVAWIGCAAYAVLHPARGLQDHMARTWIVRR